MTLATGEYETMSEEKIYKCEHGVENCCMPGYHLESECHTPEMLEELNAGFEIDALRAERELLMAVARAANEAKYKSVKVEQALAALPLETRKEIEK